MKMEFDLNTDLDATFDSLETAFSSESRRVVRQIKIEWHKITKYETDLSSKEDELFSAKEKLMHLNQIKKKNEKYLKASESRIENLKQSNIQLKSKLNNLKKELENKTKKFVADQECMDKKIAIFEKKWRERYEAYYSNNPKIRQIVKTLKEAEEIREKVSQVDVELQKCEKELFHAKCEQNKRTIEESKCYPFNTFVVNLVKIYFETTKEFEVCKKLSKEIGIVEKNIVVQKTKKLAEETSLIGKNIVAQKAKKLPAEKCSVEENIAAQKPEIKQPFTEKISNMQNVQQVHFEKNNFVESKDLTIFHKESSFNAMMGEMKINKKDEKEKSPRKEEENQYIKSERKIFQETKVQKWMEKFKIFVPKFSASPTESYKSDNETKRIEVDDSQFLRKYATANYARQSFHREKNQSFCDPEAMDDSITKKGDTSFVVKQTKPSNAATNDLIQRNVFSKAYSEKNPPDFKIDQVNNLCEEQASEKNTSKYFQMDYEIEANVKVTKTKPVVRENTKPDVCHDAMEIDELICDNENQQKSNKGIHTQEECNEEIYTQEKDLDIKQHKISEPILTPYDHREAIISTKAVSNNATIALYNSKQNKENKQGKNAFEDSTVSDMQTIVTNIVNKEMPFEVKIHTISEAETTTVTVVNEVTRISAQSKNSDFIPMEIPEIEQISYDENKTSSSDIPNVSENCSNDNQGFSQNKTCALDSSSRSYYTAVSTPKSTDSIPKSMDSIPKSMDLIPKSMDSIPKSMDSISKSMDSIPKSMDSIPKSVDFIPKSIDSIPKSTDTIVKITHQPKSSQDLAENNEEIENLSFTPFKTEDAKSPGFTYVTRLMFEASTQNDNTDTENLTRNLQRNIFAPLDYFNCNPNIPPDQSNESNEDKGEFLTSAFEEYLNDSPPMMKQGTEKSMFAYGDSPETDDGPGGFFPLFAAHNVESSNEPKDDNAPFMLNFGASTSSKSPDPNPGFKFIF